MTTKTPEQRTRAFKLLDFLLDHQNAHDQNFWISRRDAPYPEPIGAAEVLAECGTTACAAGWAIMLAGARFVGPETVVTANGAGVTVRQYARYLLGLDMEEAYDMFFLCQDLPEIKDFIESTYGPRPGAS